MSGQNIRIRSIKHVVCDILNYLNCWRCIRFSVLKCIWFISNIMITRRLPIIDWSKLRHPFRVEATPINLILQHLTFARFPVFSKYTGFKNANQIDLVLVSISKPQTKSIWFRWASQNQTKTVPQSNLNWSHIHLKDTL